jgi:hypothetical protein
MCVAAELRKLEESLLKPAVRKAEEKLSSLLAEEFCEFGSSGNVYSKAEIIAALRTEGECRITMRDFACLSIAAGVALVTYRSVRTAEGGAAVEALRSSLWVWRERRWQMLFHQGTRVDAHRVDT